MGPRAGRDEKSFRESNTVCTARNQSHCTSQLKINKEFRTFPTTALAFVYSVRGRISSSRESLNSEILNKYTIWKDFEGKWTTQREWHILFLYHCTMWMWGCVDGIPETINGRHQHLNIDLRNVGSIYDFYTLSSLRHRISVSSVTEQRLKSVKALHAPNSWFSGVNWSELALGEVQVTAMKFWLLNQKFLNQMVKNKLRKDIILPCVLMIT